MENNKVLLCIPVLCVRHIIILLLLNNKQASDYKILHEYTFAKLFVCFIVINAHFGGSELLPRGVIQHRSPRRRRLLL